MSESNRDESGRFSESVTEEDILKVFDAVEAPFLTATEVAEALSVSRQAANYRLKQMREKAIVDRKKTGARSAAWWVTRTPTPPADTAADRVGGRGLFAGDDGEAFADAVARGREEFAEGYEERQDDLFGQ